LPHQQPFVKRHRRIKLVADLEVRFEQHPPAAVFEHIEPTDVRPGDDLPAKLSPRERRLADNRQRADNCLREVHSRLIRSPRARMQFAEAVGVVLERPIAPIATLDVVKAQVPVRIKEELVLAPLRRREDRPTVEFDGAVAELQQAVADPH
jgi:hypothetical protein